MTRRFDPNRHQVAYAAMPEIDRFALHRLQSLIQRARKAYDTYEFHLIYHSLYNFCTVDLSAFYLDILKDRLYTSPQTSVERRSAQTVLFTLADTMVRLMAPVLPFTAEEIWKFMPKRENSEASVHLAALPTALAEFQDAELAEKWQRIIEVRGEVSKAVEGARAEKRVGHSLDAAVTISADEGLYQLLNPYSQELRSILIVSQVTLVMAQDLPGAYVSPEVEGLQIGVQPAEGDKCERCWVHDPAVGTLPEHPTICPRCQKALAESGL